MTPSANRTVPGVIDSGWPVLAKVASNGVQMAIAWIGAVLAVLSIWRHGLSSVEIVSFLIFYSATGIGVGVGLHRHFTHKSYEARPWFRWLIGAFGAMAFQGTILRWVADHRRHHAHADQPGDPHSPYFDSAGRPIKSRFAGLIHAHFGWMVDWSTTDNDVYGKGLMDDPVVRFYTRTYWFWVAMSLFLPWLFGYAFGGTEMAWRSLLVGGCLRIVLLHHVTWSVNSAGHMFGRRNFAGQNRSTNNVALVLMTFGDSWHNNHHEYPRSARHGLLRGELDINGMIIDGLARIGVASKVIKVPQHRLAHLQPTRPSSADISAPAEVEAQA